MMKKAWQKALEGIEAYGLTGVNLLQDAPVDGDASRSVLELLEPEK